MISKKEVLAKMNISYGQLYRWKREGLIPDVWFNKQAVSSGQETYFDENLIIPRIKKILELKDQYSIEQLKNFFSPDYNKRMFSIRELLTVREIDPMVLREYAHNKNELNIYEACILYIFSVLKEKIDIKNYLDFDFANIKLKNPCLYLIKYEKYFIIISDKDAIIDKKLSIEKTFIFADVINYIVQRIN